MVVPNSNSLETKLFKLMADKEKLESQINNYGEILAQNSNIGMSGPLVDVEGFPRNDIDVYQWSKETDAQQKPILKVKSVVDGSPLNKQ
ncbi:26S proteasome non-ATPase regulatory subunit 9 [Eumeta japonica]|uniref:26S proteasome non-ATPase regulatory subunit 9 n=1 Tax=Eumeta variegata TaxID=151549 RepID=A0A4C1SUK7_EUMVA|nr:26S proteasome non-ATPase regulatory subunit 9 [Eumeta japonica]